MARDSPLPLLVTHQYTPVHTAGWSNTRNFRATPDSDVGRVVEKVMVEEKEDARKWERKRDYLTTR